MYQTIIHLLFYNLVYNQQDNLFQIKIDIQIFQQIFINH